MKTIAIIPARCGSVEIQYKNIYPICGKPMISYTIKTLKESIVNDIFVSTDCEDVAKIATSYGARIIQRPIELAQNHSPSIDCIKHAISFLNLEDNDIIVLVQPTSPLITSTDITNGIDTFNLGSFDTIISVTENHNVLWKQDKNNIIAIGHDPCLRLNRQNMPKIYHENGAFYIFRVNNITQHNCLNGYGEVGYIEIPKSRSFQIDDYEDVFIVESIIKNAE